MELIGGGSVIKGPTRLVTKVASYTSEVFPSSQSPQSNFTALSLLLPYLVNYKNSSSMDLLNIKIDFFLSLSPLGIL